jgi:hypothetical protein
MIGSLVTVGGVALLLALWWWFARRVLKIGSSGPQRRPPLL